MLDNETKRRIDTARDILVGKVPDPKSQVEQITIALIYKFMDDMDKEAVELGGKPSFFVGDYERYAWSKIFDPRIGGYEMLNLYAEAITKLNQNPNLPQLFRDIFKNAYLPYRDPETLKLFLKTINEFSYDHSERLGDAFEYLLSVLGSQGDAGQFRTPRHIIDFMVQVVNPQKHETILDPACGTAGFLISSYKHILKENCKKIPGDLLTPEERKKLLTNFKGYDISPDMVRLSLVNMYLHGFVQPQIIEYDTLTSEDRWNEYADVILANPPFMTPKGGIKPHKKFSVQSNRSEVLFVDYIAEHLTPTGRAAIIVPEGIIFQSANAYKTLRKMLVENHLYAVVSLPAGVFKPYSGVKTSILFMDRQLAKKTDSILFVKIENDGFDLGDQRRPIDKNDLPEALKCLNEWKKTIVNKQDKQDNKDNPPKNPDNPEYPVKNFGEYNFAWLVKKEKIAEKGEYNLTGERYRIVVSKSKQKYQEVILADAVDIITPPKKLKTSEYLPDGKIPIIDQSQEFISGYTNDETAIINPSKPYIIFGDHTCTVKYIDFSFAQGADGIKILSPHEEFIPKYFYYFLKNNPIESDGYKRHYSKLKELKIPLPPLEVQREIVAEIEGYQKLIDGCRQVVDSWKPDIQGYLDDELKQYLAEHPEERDELSEGWKMVKLGDVCEILDRFRKPVEKSERKTGCYPYYGATGIVDYIDQYIFDEKLVLIGEDGAKWGAGEETAFIATGKYWVNNHAHVIRPDRSKIIDEIIVYLLNSIDLSKYITGVTVPKLNQEKLRSIQIPLPPLSVQQRIVDKIEAERKVIDGCRELIKTYEEKIKRVIDKVWEG
ncbi:Restriction modification system DNA specificity domain [Brevinematales bacterium NS]|nr:Restriction modification system DNA specificity domain [Brevinematales bacterium NS]